MAAPKAQDFIKGWPHQGLLNNEHLKTSLIRSFQKGIERSHHSLNYGDNDRGAYMFGYPDFLNTLAAFLSKQYGLPVDAKNLMTTGGSSMGTDLVCRCLCKAGDLVVVEEPTYFLAHAMARDRGMGLLGVPMQDDGMDIDALEKHLEKHDGRIKMVYTVPVHHNPTGITMSEEKRQRLVALARKHKFVIAADEVYQLLNFDQSTTKPLFYYDDPADPRVVSVGSFSKLIGPGLKIGWMQAHPSLLKPCGNVGFIDSGNNPVIFASCNLIDFLESGAMDKHLELVSKDLSGRCDLICKKLREVGLEVVKPKGGYFVWVRSKGKMTGKSGEAMAVNKDQFHDWMRLCFAWLPADKLEEGIEFLRP